MARTSKKGQTAAPKDEVEDIIQIAESAGYVAKEITGVDPESLVDGQEDELAEILALAEPEVKKTVRPVVTRLPPNFRLVICDVGPHHNVRVMVRPNNKNYIHRMEIPLDVDLDGFDPNGLLIFNGDPPRRKGMW